MGCGSIRRAPCGARGLKFFGPPYSSQKRRSRAPCGARGLKSSSAAQAARARQSRPMRGAWIEIRAERAGQRGLGVAPHAGRVD